MNIDANKIIDRYRKLVDQLQYENMLMQEQLESMQDKQDDKKEGKD